MSNETRYSMEHLLTWRESMGLSHQKLADRAGTTKATIIRLEKGQHAANGLTANKIAAALGITRDQLVAGPSSQRG